MKPIFQISKIIILVISLLFYGFTSVHAVDRVDEIRTEMWNTADKNFQVREVPTKWQGKSAVIIAQLNRYEYRKPIMLGMLRYNEYNHYRIKLNDKNAINKYSEMSFYNDRVNNLSGESIKVFVGFKIVKPTGKEIVVDLATAVKMEKESKGRKQSYNKLAIPNLEIGDILDYYICEEATKVNNSLIYFFDPVIYHLPREYPVINHKLQFRAERKCYINLKSLNGAPELKLVTDESNDEQYYTFEGMDIEPLDDQRWLFPYRELPSIKFRAAYASGKGMRAYNVLLGEPGEAKSSVSKKELEQLVGTMMASEYDIKTFKKFAKSNLKDVKDPFEIARQAYYFYRNDMYALTEAAVVEGNAMPDVSEIKFTDVMHTVLAYKKIPHDVILAVPRNISVIDDVLMEDEIEWLIRVRDGDKELYLSPYDLNTVPGRLDPLLEDTEAYALDGMAKTWSAKKITLPVTTAANNRSELLIDVTLDDLTKAKVSVKKTLTGRNKLGDQYMVMDIYDFVEEEKSKFKMGESFEGYSFYKKKYVALKDAYMASRGKNKENNLKESIESNFDLKAKNPGNLVIEQTGRYDHSPAMIYTFTFETEDLVKKTGQNYLIDAGKLMERQTKIETDELNRKTNIYFENPRSFAYRIVIDIPSGYQAQGLDKFNQKVENKVGGFSSTAKEEKGKLIIETNKHYDVNYATLDQWPSLVSFLNAASSFSEQKILLKKK